MTDFDLTEFFLTGMLTFGPPALGLALLIGALGLPVPGTLFVLAAGAFIRQGIMDLASTAGLGWLGAVLGDSASYAIGYLVSSISWLLSFSLVTFFFCLHQTIVEGSRACERKVDLHSKVPNSGMMVTLANFHFTYTVSPYLVHI